MTILELARQQSDHPKALTAGIFDVDGVLLASPHERACREALKGFADSGRFTTAMYEAHVAGKPRLSGARAALEALGVSDFERQAVVYAEHKQKRLMELIHAGSVAAFPDALRFVQAVGALGWPMAVASSSKNANQMMRLIHFDAGRHRGGPRRPHDGAGRCATSGRGPAAGGRGESGGDEPGRSDSR